MYSIVYRKAPCVRLCIRQHYCRFKLPQTLSISGYPTRVPLESLTLMVISLALVNGSHHWPVIKWFLPCSTSDNCNHMDRIVLCGRQDEDPGYLFEELITSPQVVMEFCISSMDPHLYGRGYAQICICMT